MSSLPGMISKRDIARAVAALGLGGILLAACKRSKIERSVQPADAGVAAASAAVRDRRPSGTNPPGPDAAQLAARIAAVDADLAERMRAGPNRVDAIATPFFGDASIYTVTIAAPPHPVAFTVGCASDGTTLLLSDRPDAFAELVRHAGLDLSRADYRNGYVVAFLRSTRSFAKRFQVLETIDALEPRKALTTDQRERYERLVETYRSVIVPLRLEPARADGDGADANGRWKGSVFALRNQALVRLDVALAASGAIRVDDTVLEDDLPIPYAL